MTDSNVNYRGELAALLAALCWAIASAIYERLGQRLPPLQLNFLKGVIAIGFLAATLPIAGAEFPDIDRQPVGLLLVSGAVGIGIGDTAFFNSIDALGARRALLFETLAPPLTALLALTCLGEVLSPGAWFGIALTAIGVAWTIGERRVESSRVRRQTARGIAWGLLAAGSQAGGASLSRAALVDTEISPLWSALLRLIAGTVCLVPLMSFRSGTPRTSAVLIDKDPQERTAKHPSLVRSPRLLATVTLAAFLGTYLGIWLQQTALKHAPAGIAQTLSATSPLFVLPIAFALGDKLSLRAVLGAGVALAGIFCLFRS
ncbi:putative membrane protein [Rubidibacter lacunae KORDI 51-2]|uniref:Putative membrane protein n=1 Tax=Rubidibacter lacunae KORDI 51-2 TaxID=582515 RepID=U5D5Y2_9CHRO|nr:DMT family transporter [Rubidibacter lacunae]ERN40063.1 putative membrane protein [Rubidibacter lacunae KORDI 51-2]